MPTFVANFKHALLTYPQCGALDPFRIVDHLGSLGSECIVGRELHADGGVHLHAFCSWEKKFRSRRVDIFDVDGCHPNISPSRGSPEAGYDYAIKDGDIVAGGLDRPSVDGAAEDGSKWRQIISAESAEEFWRLLEELDPRSLCLQYASLRAFADWRYKEEPRRYSHPSDIGFRLDMVPELLEWRDATFGGPRVGRPVSLVIYGPSKVGKTTWARSLGNHVYFMGMMSGEVALRDMPDAQYAVFDDMRGGIEFFPAWKEWLGGQAVVTVKKLYRDPMQLEWGKPSIWLSNTDPRGQLKHVDDVHWLEANCKFVELSSSIVHANTE